MKNSAKHSFLFVSPHQQTFSNNKKMSILFKTSASKEPSFHNLIPNYYISQKN